jgi:hypothetical protein
MLLSNSDKENFLSNVAFGITLAGTAQRGKLYNPASSPGERKKFRLALRRSLESLAQRYSHPVSDETNFANIENLSDTLTAEHRNALGGRFRIGSAQKALNLYLKMLWCFDRIPTPPHCPFDRIVLSHVPDCERIKWTELDSPSEYRRIVQCARSVSGGSLAEWELHSYTEWLSASRVSADGAT